MAGCGTAQGTTRFQFRRGKQYDPHGDTHLRTVKQFDPESLTAGFQNATKRLLSVIESEVTFRRPVTVAIDITMHPKAQGYLRVENSLFGGWPDNGIYVIGGQPGTGDGTVDVVNCIAANSQASNIRIGGDNSRIHNCVVVTDRSFGEEFYYEQRPIRIDDGTCTVSNTKIIQQKPTGWSLTIQHAVWKAVVKNVKISMLSEAIRNSTGPLLVVVS